MPKPLIEIKKEYINLDKQFLDLKYAGINEVYLLVGYMWNKIKKRKREVRRRMEKHSYSLFS